MNCFRIIFLAFLCFLFASFASVRADSVRLGTEAFGQGEYEKSAEAFAAAEERTPNDFRVTFNRGAALAAAKKWDDAVSVLRRSAISENRDVAARSLELLGQIAVERAKSILSENPVETPDSDRNEVRELLQVAQKYYNEAIELIPNESSHCRESIEQIRAWKQRIESEWRDFDRIKWRETELPERLQWLENWEEKVRSNIEKAAAEIDSPKKYQTFFETVRDQSEMRREISLLRETIESQIDSITKQSETDQRETEKSETDQSETEKRESDASKELIQQQQQTAEFLRRELTETEKTAEKVESALRQFQGDDAQKMAKETTDRINRLRTMLLPFEAVVKEAEMKQANLCQSNPNRQQNRSENNNLQQNEPKQDATNQDATNYSADSSDTHKDIDLISESNKIDSQKDENRPSITEQVREQRQVERLIPLMVFRAEQGLQSQTETKDDSNAPETKPVKVGQNGDASAISPENHLQKAMELAIQLGPEIEELAANAAILLSERPDEALQKQEKALELLREILKEADQNQEQQNDKDKQNQNQEQQNDKDKQNQNQEQQSDKDKQNQNQEQQSDKDKQNQNQEQQSDKDKQNQNQEQQNDKDKQNQNQEQQNDKDKQNQNQEQQSDKDKQNQNQEQQSDKDNQNQNQEQQNDKDKQNQNLEQQSEREKQQELDKADRMLRQVKRRQQEVNERRDRVRSLLMQSEPVEKDW
ncbi:MAG: hypothetical protein ACRCUY_02975 [Thermoguttaceae bacterium]